MGTAGGLLLTAVSALESHTHSRLQRARPQLIRRNLPLTGRGRCQPVVSRYLERSEMLEQGTHMLFRG